MAAGSTEFNEATEKVSAPVAAYRQIRAKILSNEMPAGFQITELDLATSLNLSRTPVREALLRLETEGLIDIRPRHGMRVRPLSIEDLREIYQVVTPLEASAASLAAQRPVSRQVLKDMRASITEMDNALASDNLVGWANADRDFHRQLVEASGNSRITEIIETLNGQAHRVRMITLTLRPKPTASNRDHEAVLNAIEKGDASEAERIHRQHREQSGAMLIELLQRHRLTAL